MMTVEEVAKLLRLNPRTVYRLLERGKLPGVKMGRQWRVSEEGLPGAARGMPVPVPAGRSALAGLLQAAIDQVLQEVDEDDFTRFFTEADIAGRLAEILRQRLGPAYEVHLQLRTAGGAGRPDVSVTPAHQPWSDRRGARAVFSAEIKFFSYHPSGFLITAPLFASLLADLERQFNDLARRIRQGSLDYGWLLWVDAFDWENRCPQNLQPQQVIDERVSWFRGTFDQPGSRVRADYLPILFPEKAVSLPNGFAAPPPFLGSLFGAARPFIRRWPAPDEDWNERVEEAAAESWREKTRAESAG
jgi:excisionase family DNA binding protein